MLFCLVLRLSAYISLRCEDDLEKKEILRFEQLTDNLLDNRFFESTHSSFHIKDSRPTHSAISKEKLGILRA